MYIHFHQNLCRVLYTHAFEGEKIYITQQPVILSFQQTVTFLGFLKHFHKILPSVFYEVIYILWPLGCQMLTLCPLVAQIISMLFVMEKTGDAFVRKLFLSGILCIKECQATEGFAPPVYVADRFLYMQHVLIMQILHKSARVLTCQCNW